MASLTVVLAAWPGTNGVAEALEALDPQRDPGVEVIVVAPRPRPAGLDSTWASWREASGSVLIPHLWALGIAAAKGDLVALTTAQFAPASDWVAVQRAAHARLAAAAIGGPIEPSEGGGPVAWATYFLRYSAYLRYDREQLVEDLAGDNVCYKRAALEAHSEPPGGGFWEHEVHERLRRAGQTLCFVPAMRVIQRGHFGFVPFLKQRFAHGRRFGAARFRGRPLALRAVALLASPLVPPLLLGRILLRVARRRSRLVPFVACLPALICFVLAWSLGESVGYARGAR